MLAAGLVLAAVGPCSRSTHRTGARAKTADAGSNATVLDPLSNPAAEPSIRRAPGIETTAFEPVVRFGTGPIRLRVVERGRDAGIPAAKVTFMNMGASLNRFVNFGPGWIGTDGENTLNAEGQSTITNDDGEVSIPCGPGGRIVCARKGDWFGVDDLEAYASGDKLLELDRQQPLEVRVVDETGIGVAGITVGLRAGVYATDIYPTPTDVEGRARFRNLLTLLNVAGFYEERAIEVCAEFPLQPRVSE